ncbi:MAG: aldehyde dehydrogenase family protein [Deltaproteobacteria bacterium]|nr:aldehyde dehydrogenase family protein [Deltaproteobacteria bacterium]
MQTIDNGSHAQKTLKACNIIHGQEVFSDTNTLTSKNPANIHDIVAIAPTSAQEDIDQALQAAHAMRKTWKQTPAPIRAQVIGKLGELVSKHKDELAAFMTREMGKTFKESQGEVQEVIDTCHFFQSEGRRLYGQTVPSEMRNKELFTYRRPYGVVAMITPSNFPIAVASWKAIPAILCGNTVVWKTPPEAPGIAYLFTKLWHQAGLPAGVLNLVHGDGQTGQYLMDEVATGRIQKVSFTGSTRVGKIIGEICGRHLQVPSLELGGKNPLIVMEDANLDLALEGAIWGSFGTAGQRCTSTGNIILHKDIADTFTQRFVEKAKNIHIGNPNTDRSVLYGPMIDEHYVNHFMEHFDHAKQDGASLLYGNGRITKDSKPASFTADPDVGYYVWPTIWSDVTINQWIAQNEVFGPAVSLIKVSSIEEAIDVANGTSYGLSSAIYTNSRMHAYTFKENIEAGMSSINNSTTGAEAHLPFGGVKGSGNGTRESGIWVVDAFTQWHAINDELSGKLQLAQMDTEFVQTQTENLHLHELI